MPVGDGHLFLAGERVARDLNLPVILWTLDDWRGGAGKELTKVLPEMEESLRRCATRSIARFAVSKEMAERYEYELGGEWKVLCNGLDKMDIPEANAIRTLSNCSFKVGFFGAVYSVQVDPLENLCKACQKLGIEIVVYGDVDPNLRPRLSRLSCLTLYDPVDEDAARNKMKNCDALYLPYSFNTSSARVVETSFPTKMADYIAAGVPVIINGPPNSTIIKFSRRTGWGIPVDDACSNALEIALSNLRSKYDEYLSQSSPLIQRAAAELDLASMRESFLEALLETVETAA